MGKRKLEHGGVDGEEQEQEWGSMREREGESEGHLGVQVCS